MKNPPSTVQACIEYGAQQFDDADLFFGHGTDNAHDEAFWLVFFALSLPFDADEAVFSQSVSAEQWALIDALFLRRVSERVPAAYLTGEGWFCGYSFAVNEHVLVPRSPIAELIQYQFQPWLHTEPTRILDMCTGCGCIGIATALSFAERPHLQVDISDISPDALSVASQNIARYQLNDRVTAVRSDVFSAMAGQQYDLIVTNPPYVDASDLAAMPAEYQAEPAIALGSGDDGLDITRRLLREAADYLSPEGIMIVEVGNSWENLEAAFPQVPFLWLEFESGGHGVFLIRRDELIQYQAEFA
jgi:ribosomal protein L3 glutamine methyltransferase